MPFDAEEIQAFHARPLHASEKTRGAGNELGGLSGVRTLRSNGAGADSGPSDMTFDALAVGPCFRANSEIDEQLGGTVVDHPTCMGSSLPAQANGATDVSGVWAVGNSADISAMVVASAASGVMVGAQINAELIMSSVS